MRRKILSFLIPVYNERATIEEIIKRVLSADTGGYTKELIVVDDYSSDGSYELLKILRKKYKFILLRHQENLGKGAGIRTALRRSSGDLVITQDADLEYDPRDVKKMLLNFDERKHPIIYGSRNLGPSPKGYFLTHLVGSFITILFNFLYKTSLTDLHTGYKLYRGDIIRGVKLTVNGFDFCHEITANIVKSGFQIKEVPITYKPRSFGEGKKVRAKDAFLDIWTTIRCKISNV